MKTNVQPFYRGDTVEWKLEFTDEQGGAVDISQWKVYLTLKESRSLMDRHAMLQMRYLPGPGTDSEEGVFYLQLSATLTETFPPGRYFGDVQIIKADGVVRTFDIGSVKVLTDITRITQ